MEKCIHKFELVPSTVDKYCVTSTRQSSDKAIEVSNNPLLPKRKYNGVGS